jgi:hypothetical protein
MSVLHRNKLLARIVNVKEEDKYAKQSFHPNGLDIPIQVFKKYCKVLKS